MSQIPQILFHSQLPTNKPRLMVRNSDDFFPGKALFPVYFTHVSMDPESRTSRYLQPLSNHGKQELTSISPRRPLLPPLPHLHQRPHLPPNLPLECPPGLGHVPNLTPLLLLPRRRPLHLRRTNLHHRYPGPTLPAPHQLHDSSHHPLHNPHPPS